MKRDYQQGIKTDVKFFKGLEIEHTRFFGMETLFVVGIPFTAKIIKLAHQHNINHIYLGANHSDFSYNQAEDLLDLGFYVTIDAVEEDAIAIENERFQLIVRFKLNENLITDKTHLKFYSDDLNRKGIYVIPSTLIEEEQHYTDNSEYGNDIIINED